LGYIGSIPADKFQTLQKQSFSTSATATYTLSYAVTNPQDLALFINNVRQNPNDAYTVSGTTLTLSAAITGSDTMYAVFLGKSVETIAPALSSVTNDMLAGSIANSKLANSSITLNGSAVSLGGSATIGGGKMGQLISATVSDIVQVTSSSGTFADVTGFTASITPSATNSKVLVMCAINFGTTGNTYGAVRLVRGSTAVGIGDAAGSRARSSAFTSGNDNSKAHSATFDFLDSPSSTSEQVYKIQVTLNSGQTFKLNSEGENIDNAANHRTISTITLMEVLA